MGSRRLFASPFAGSPEDGLRQADTAAHSSRSKQAKWWARRSGGLDLVPPRQWWRPKRLLFGAAVLAVLLYAIFRRRSTLVLSKAEVAKVWKWELASGRYPSRRPPLWGLKETNGVVENVGVPRERGSNAPLGSVRGVGRERQYLPTPTPSLYDASSSSPPPSPHPPRPALNSAIDLDVVMDHCDFSEKKYVRDCLHLLRVNAGLSEGRRFEKNDLRHTFLPLSEEIKVVDGPPKPKELAILNLATSDMASLLTFNDTIFSALVNIEKRVELSSPISHPTLPRTPPHPTHPTADPSCDPSQPRIFHIYWAGPFTDKPYVAALSFLYTQQLGLSLPLDAPPSTGLCRPQLWFWINPGSASSLPDEHAERKMTDTLIANEWSAPLLNPRFREAIRFKLWNSTEQLNAIPELKGWDSKGFFKSGGVKYKQHAKKSASPPRKRHEETAPEPRQEVNEGRPSDVGEDELSRFGRPVVPVDILPDTTSGEPAPTKLSSDDELFNRVGSAAESDYDRLSVILSDMARFVLTYRYGGVYLDADTIFLRDWEEMWGWRGAFAYRWSRLKVYNTAVLKMARGSALGSTILRTAFENGLDFHPMVVSRYLKELRMEELLLRLPDALFDPAWLNVWLPFDPSRNFPDLGTRFPRIEQQQEEPQDVEGDLSWATVLKRTFEKYLRGEAPNMYGEELHWGER
ncbi:DDB1- and CUL4-associated factor 13, partial [Phenoliferia sp. Uapishka_3]